MCWVWVMAVWFGEFYFLDVVAFQLDTGVIIKTAEPIDEDKYFYSWKEGNHPITLEKSRVRSVRYSTMRVPGRRPHQRYRNAVQRRISGLGITYQRDGITFLKCRHVDERGRGAEGMAVPNHVTSLQQVSSDNSGETLLLATFSQLTKETRMMFRFYNMEGKRLYETFLAADWVLAENRPRHGKTRYRFSIPASIELESLGLIEVVSITNP